jgi:DNA invertase Pin-like site-specific DNA recombinase
MPSMRFGYIRVSTVDQWTRLQDDALALQNCDRVFRDKMTGTRMDRTEFLKMLEIVREGDVVVVWRLDRLSRSLKDLLELSEYFQKKGIELHSINEHIDTTTANGRLMFQIHGMLAEFERNLTVERINAGLAAARARGIVGGRPKVTEQENPPDVKRAMKLYTNKDLNGLTVKDIMKTTGFHNRDTFYRYMKEG